MERDNLLAALEAARGKVTGPEGAAALLGVNPNTLASRIRALGLTKVFVGQSTRRYDRVERRLAESYTDGAH